MAARRPQRALYPVSPRDGEDKCFESVERPLSKSHRYQPPRFNARRLFHWFPIVRKLMVQLRAIDSQDMQSIFSEA